MRERLPAILLAVHLVYAFALPATSARAVSAIGCAVALAWIAGPRLSRRLAERVAQDIPAARHVSVAALALFALPLVSLFFQPRVAFWRLDGRALLIAAWLVTIAWLVAQRAATGTAAAARGRHLSLLTQLFILWSSLFWMTVIWDVGVGQAVVQVTKEERLVTSFELWETRPASEHLFLVWLNRDSFAKGIAYSNHLHPITFFFYACSKGLQLATGLPLYIGRNLTPFAMAALGVLAFGALVPRPSSRNPSGLGFHSAVFLALGFFLSEWHFWMYPFAWAFDTVFPVIAYLTALVWASAYPRISGRNAGRLTAALALFAAFGWLYTPLVIVALWCVFARMRMRLGATLRANLLLVRASIVALVIGAVVYSVPLVLIALKDYQNTSSPFVFRAGLDGDTRYFQNVIQAVVQPFRPARPFWTVLFPVFVPFLVAVAVAWPAKRRRRWMGRQAVFLLAPYFLSLALSPQAVSIHPNLYDMLLVLPIALMGATWTLALVARSRIGSAGILAAVLTAVTLIMSNLIAIAQGVQRLAAG